jgi:hypothetical protein
MGAFFDFLTIITILVWLVGLAAHGFISPETTALCLVVLVVLIAIGRAAHIGLVRTVFRIGLPVVSVVAFATYYGGGNRQTAVDIVAQLCMIGLILFGMYFIVSGPFRR